MHSQFAIQSDASAIVQQCTLTCRLQSSHACELLHATCGELHMRLQYVPIFDCQAAASAALALSLMRPVAARSSGYHCAIMCTTQQAIAALAQELGSVEVRSPLLHTHGHQC